MKSKRKPVTRDLKKLPKRVLTAGAIQTNLHDREEDPLKEPSANVTFPIVGVGASAGGLEACLSLLGSLRKDPDMAFVFVNHLSAKSESLLPEILQRGTSLPVLRAKQGLVVKKNHVYVIPPNTNLGIIKGKLQVMTRIEPPGRHRPVDVFFRCLADDRKESAIGVILSGGDGDGAAGLKAIKAEGGITFAQEPSTAKVDGMPKQAILSGAVDYTLPPEKIAEELNQIGNHAYYSKSSRIGQFEGNLSELDELLNSSAAKPEWIFRTINFRWLPAESIAEWFSFGMII